MSASPQTVVTVDEEFPLHMVPGTQDAYIDVNGGGAASCCRDNHYRRLAVCSIICGISCIGIKSLINSVQAEREPNHAKAAEFTRRARKLGIISISTWVCILVLTPLLLGLGSYLVTLRD